MVFSLEWLALSGLCGVAVGGASVGWWWSRRHQEALTVEKQQTQAAQQQLFKAEIQYGAENTRLSQQLAAAEQQATSVTETLNQLQSLNQDLERRFSAQTATLEGLQTQLRTQKDLEVVQQTELIQLRTNLMELTAEKTHLQTSFDEVRRQFEEWKTLLDGQWSEKFKLLSQSTLMEVTKRLQESSRDDEEQRKKRLKEDLENQLAPMIKNFTEFREKVTLLDAHVTTLSSAKDQLVSVLKTNKGAGSWGELELIRILEFVGLKRDVDYEFQPNESNGYPDVKVFLPERGFVYIDAKTIRLNPDEVTSEDNQEASLENQEARRRSVLDSLKAAIKDLGKKDYTRAIAGTPDFVVLFVPRESMLSTAYELQPSLWEEALNKNIILASPFNLIGLLRIVRFGWHQVELSQQVHEIRQLGGELHGKLVTFFDKMVKLDRAIQQVHDCFEDTQKTFNGRGGLVSKAKKLEAFGCPSGKSLPKELQEADLLMGEDEDNTRLLLANGAVGVMDLSSEALPPEEIFSSPLPRHS